MLRPGLVALVVAGVSLCGARARADVVMPPPDDCPAGSKAQTCHGGPHCAVSSCADDTACKEGETCQQTKWCIKQVNCASRIPTPSYVDAVTGSCSGGTCGEGSCKTVKVCAKPGALTPSRGCSCDVAATPGGGSWVALGAVMALALALRRRRD